MIEAEAVKDFYYTETKQAYRKGRKYLFTKEQFQTLYKVGYVKSDIQEDTKAEKIEIKAVSDKKKRYIKYKNNA